MSPSSPNTNDTSEGRSTCCANIWYDAEIAVLTIRFQQRGTYRYYNVDPYSAAQLIEAASQGKEFNYMIRNRYAYDRIG